MCLFGFGLFVPRLVMVVLALTGDYLSSAYDTVLLPVLGFFLMPTTTLGYAIAVNSLGGWDTVGGAIVIALGAGLDLGLWGSGRGLFNRR